MTTFSQRLSERNDARGHLCVGIDPRPGTFPAAYDEPEGFERWCLDLVDATAEHAAAYKPNLAFFLDLGPPGLETLEAVVERAKASGALVILDAKFGDIGSTASMYAAFARNVVAADAVTLNPYLGTDVVAPFIDQGLDVFVLARTTNPSADTIQRRISGRVIELFAELGVGFVAPGNEVEILRSVRNQAKNAPLLIPGVGAQGGSATEAARAAAGGPFLVNSSRGIALAEGSFPESAGQAAEALAEALQR